MAELLGLEPEKLASRALHSSPLCPTVWGQGPTLVMTEPGLTPSLMLLALRRGLTAFS